MAEPRNVLIMGAAGRDFFNFLVRFRDDPTVRVRAFTATQIPGIESRRFPASLAGPLYPDGIPIFPEEDLPRLIVEYEIDEVVFAYSDVDYPYVMHRASLANALGADFALLGTRDTMLKANVPVIAVTAVRTGSGKSQTTRRLAQILMAHGKKVVVVRHPMPYGELAEQAVERFAKYEDLERYKATIEEREEYEPHIEKGIVVYAGIDYERILREAEREAEILIWDGGNNDTPFYKPDLHIVVADPLRPGHELSYYPGETNFRMADVIVINKVDSAKPEDVELVKRNAVQVNPDAIIVEAASPISLADEAPIRNRKALVIEDVRRRCNRGAAVRGIGDRGPETVRGRVDQDDVQEVPAPREGPPRDGVRREADQRTRGDDQRGPLRRRCQRDSRGPWEDSKSEQARRPRPVRTRRDRPSESRGCSPGVEARLTSRFATIFPPAQRGTTR